MRQKHKEELQKTLMDRRQKTAYMIRDLQERAEQFVNVSGAHFVALASSAQYTEAGVIISELAFTNSPWDEITVRAEAFLIGWRNRVVDTLKKQGVSREEIKSIRNYLRPWMKPKFIDHLKNISDPTKIQHKRANKQKCILYNHGINRDETIFELIRHEIMYLYDPCVIWRIWQADLTADAQFLRKLGKILSEYVIKAPGNSKYNRLRLILSEFNRVGMVNLSESDPKKAKLEWQLVARILKEIGRDCDFTNQEEKKLFEQGGIYLKSKFGKWFKNGAVKYSRKNFDRIRIHETKTSINTNN